MRKSAFIFAFFLCMGMLQSQENQNLVSEGDLVTLGPPSGSSYQHIDFPRKNIIIKRGAIADFNALLDETLVVETITTDNDGNNEAILKRQDGKKFFRFFPTVKANIDLAIENGELKTIDLRKVNAIAQQ